jgi:hypothetical protein
MSEIIAFEIYRTENIAIKGETFAICFSKRKSGEEYALFAVNDAQTKRWRGFYSPETAADFARVTGLPLEKEVYAIFKADIENMQETQS